MKRYIIRYRGDWVCVFDAQTHKFVARFWGWDEGYDEALAYIDTLD